MPNWPDPIEVSDDMLRQMYEQRPYMTYQSPPTMSPEAVQWRELEPQVRSLAEDVLRIDVEEENDQFRRMPTREQDRILRQMVYRPRNAREAQAIGDAVQIAVTMLRDGFREDHHQGRTYQAINQFRRNYYNARPGRRETLRVDNPRSEFMEPPPGWREDRPRPVMWREPPAEPAMTHVSMARGQGEIRDNHMALMNQAFGRIPEAVPAPAAPTPAREPRTLRSRGRPHGRDTDLLPGDVWVDTATGTTWAMSSTSQWYQTSPQSRSRSAGYFTPGESISRPSVTGAITGRHARVEVIDEVQSANDAPHVAPSAEPVPRPVVRPGSFHDVLARREAQANELIAAVGDMDREAMVHMILSFLPIEKSAELIAAVKRANNQ